MRNKKDTRQNKNTRQISYLPSAPQKAHGKTVFCRVLTAGHSAKMARAPHVTPAALDAVTEISFAVSLLWSTRQIFYLPSVRILTLGKVFICRVLYSGTRQSTKKNSSSALQTFLSVLIIQDVLHIEIWYYSQ